VDAFFAVVDSYASNRVGRGDSTLQAHGHISMQQAHARVLFSLAPNEANAQDHSITTAIQLDFMPRAQVHNVRRYTRTEALAVVCMVITYN
jgi:hypothetical protein